MARLQKKTLADADLWRKRILVRADLDAPCDADGTVTDDSGLVASVPTIRHLLERRARVVLMGHRGRPDGKPDRTLGLAPVAGRLQELLERPVVLLDGCVEPSVVQRARQASERHVVVLENTRFYTGDEAGDLDFANGLARHGEMFVLDVFEMARYPHASVSGVARFLPTCAGLSLEKEIDQFSRVLHDPAHPFVVVLGGDQIPDRLRALANLIATADKVLVGGALALTFLEARGLGCGCSKVDESCVDEARRQLAELGDRLLVPADLVTAARAEPWLRKRVVRVEEHPADCQALDIGPATVRLFGEALAGAKTVVWNGPMGVSELEDFSSGTEGLARAIAGLPEALTVVGGRASATALARAGLTGKVSHVTTGGGASLALLQGLDLPGIAAIQDKVAC
ncbi:MAG: phosphoglycerate kinase [Candidatus Riflebacteria bacterium]|nr:phosphoglycerate kinase [Candidatus Riflebacteria bacterium]